MKTDSLFYRIFQTAPGILLELAGGSPADAKGYEFRSVELKQTAFRIDGVLIPTQDVANQPVYFVEVQFQPDAQLYHRFFAELFLYLAQNSKTADWRGVLIYPNRQVSPKQTPLYQQLIDSSKVQEIYLNELENVDLSLGVSLVKLIVEPKQTTINQAKALIQRSDQGATVELSQSEILDLVETILVYKFNLSRKEIITMFELHELEQTRFYQEVSVEVLQKDHQQHLEQLLNDRFGSPISASETQERLQAIQALLQLEGNQFFHLTTALARESSQRSLLETLKARFQQIPAPVMAQIEQATNTTLEAWIWLALTVESIDAFAEAIAEVNTPKDN